MGKGDRPHECAPARFPGRVGTSLANRIGQRDHLHQHGPHLTLGGDARIDEGGRCDPPSGIAGLSLRSIRAKRARNCAEQRGVRPEPTRSQFDLGFARPRSGRRDGPIRCILGSGYHRNARKQSERGVPASLIVTRHSDHPPNGCFKIHTGCVARLSACHGSAAATTVCQNSAARKATTRTRRIRPCLSRAGVIAGRQPVGIAHAKLLGRPPATQPHPTLIKIS